VASHRSRKNRRGGEKEDDTDIWAAHISGGSSEKHKLVKCRGVSHMFGALNMLNPNGSGTEWHTSTRKFAR
jgi:hypothetical protein